MISFIIPTVYDPSLTNTMRDIEDRSELSHETIVVDGRKMGMRSAINEGVRKAKYSYICKVDDHCTFGKGFDRKLWENYGGSQVVIPTRYSLDVERWEVTNEAPIEHERLAVQEGMLKGVRWVSKSRAMKDEMIAEDMMFQGSFYFMSIDHWHRIGGLQTDGYGEFSQEAVEIALKTWEVGGRVIKNKHTWYAHKHRSFGRHQSPSGTRQGNEWGYNYWTTEKKDVLDSYLDYFNAH